MSDPSDRSAYYPGEMMGRSANEKRVDALNDEALFHQRRRDSANVAAGGSWYLLEKADIDGGEHGSYQFLPERALPGQFVEYVDEAKREFKTIEALDSEVARCNRAAAEVLASPLADKESDVDAMVIEQTRYLLAMREPHWRTFRVIRNVNSTYTGVALPRTGTSRESGARRERATCSSAHGPPGRQSDDDPHERPSRLARLLRALVALVDRRRR